MSVELYLDEKLVVTGLKATTKEEVLETLSHKLFEEGSVKEAYIKAIGEREKEYPTGLPSTPPAIAIPHANYDLVNKTSLAIATLETPVLFNNMEDKKNHIPVQIVIMMAIGEPHGQVEMLQKIVSIIQDEAFRQKMLETTDPLKLIEMIKKFVL